MSLFVRLLSPRSRSGETLETAGLPPSIISLMPSVGLMVLLLMTEAFVLIAVLIGPMFMGMEGMHPAWLIPTRLIGIYGLLLTQRQRPLFMHTWLRTPFNRMADLWWAWTLPLIIVVISAVFFLIAPLIQSETNATALFYTTIVLAWLSLLSLVPTWLWCLIQSVMVLLRVRNAPIDLYQRN